MDGSLAGYSEVQTVVYECHYCPLLSKEEQQIQAHVFSQHMTFHKFGDGQSRIVPRKEETFTSVEGDYNNWEVQDGNGNTDYEEQDEHMVNKAEDHIVIDDKGIKAATARAAKSPSSKI